MIHTGVNYNYLVSNTIPLSTAIFFKAECTTTSGFVISMGSPKFVGVLGASSYNFVSPTDDFTSTPPYPLKDTKSNLQKNHGKWYYISRTHAWLRCPAEPPPTPDMLLGWGICLVFIAITLLVSYLTYRFVEVPPREIGLMRGGENKWSCSNSDFSYCVTPTPL